MFLSYQAKLTRVEVLAVKQHIASAFEACYLQLQHEVHLLWPLGGLSQQQADLELYQVCQETSGSKHGHCQIVQSQRSPSPRIHFPELRLLIPPIYSFPPRFQATWNPASYGRCCLQWPIPQCREHLQRLRKIKSCYQSASSRFTRASDCSNSRTEMFSL
jgi:hypothetical protein